MISKNKLQIGLDWTSWDWIQRFVNSVRVSAVDGVRVHSCHIWRQIINRDYGHTLPSVISPICLEIHQQTVTDRVAVAVQEQNYVLSLSTTFNLHGGIKYSFYLLETDELNLRTQFDFHVLILVVKEKHFGNCYQM